MIYDTKFYDFQKNPILYIYYRHFNDFEELSYLIYISNFVE